MRLDGRIRYDNCSDCGQWRPIARQRDCLCEFCLNRSKKKAFDAKPKVTTGPRQGESMRSGIMASAGRNSALNAALDKFYRGVWRLQSLGTGYLKCIECGQVLGYAAIHVSHIITRGSNPSPWYAFNTLNWLPMCSEHHGVFENGMRRKQMKCYPVVKDRIVTIMAEAMPFIDEINKHYWPGFIKKT